MLAVGGNVLEQSIRTRLGFSVCFLYGDRTKASIVFYHCLKNYAMYLLCKCLASVRLCYIVGLWLHLLKRRMAAGR